MMMTVSTAVIVAILILGVCLVVTSAVLGYKLRPDKNAPLIRRKQSTQSSTLLSPLRRMTLVNGLIIADEEKAVIQKPTRSFMPKWSTLYSSRRTSPMSGRRYSRAAIYPPNDLETQAVEDYEKAPRIDVEERLSFERSRRGRRSQRPSSIQFSKTDNQTQHGSRSYRRDDSTEEITSPKSFPISSSPRAFSIPPSPRSYPIPPSPRSYPIPPSPRSIPGLPSPKSILHISSSESTRMDGIHRKPIVKADQAVLDQRLSSPPPRSRRRVPQPREPFDPSFFDRTSNSAVNLRTLTSKSPSNPLVIIPKIPKPDSTSNSPPVSTKPISINSDSEEIRAGRVRSSNLETIVEATTSPPQPSQEFKTRRSVSLPEVVGRSSPITTIVEKHRPPPLRITKSNIKSTSISKNLEREPHDTILTSDTEQEDIPTKTNGSNTPPLILSSNITDFVSTYPFLLSPSGRSRQSISTMTSSQYSPNFSLASAHPMTLIFSKKRPQSSDSPAIRLDIPSPASIVTRPVPTSKYRQSSTSFRKPSFPPASSNSALSSHPPIRSRAPVSKSTKSLTPLSIDPLGRIKRPSRYSHLTNNDKSLPKAPQSTKIFPGSSYPTANVSIGRRTSSLRNQLPRSLETLEFQAALRSTSSAAALSSVAAAIAPPAETSLKTLPLPPLQPQLLLQPDQSRRPTSYPASNISLHTRPSHDETRESVLATYYLDDDDDDDNDDDETPDEQANGTEAGGGIMVIHRLQEEGTVEEVERALVSPITIRAKSQSKSRRTSRSHSRSHSSSIESQSEGQSLRDQRMKMHTPIGVSPLAEEFPRQIVMLGRSDSDSASRSRSSSLGLKADLLGALDVGVGLDMGEDFGKGFFFG